MNIGSNSLVYRQTQPALSRRDFLAMSGAGMTAALLAATHCWADEPAKGTTPASLDFPLVDFHVHLDNSTIDKVLELSKKQGVKFGIVEHAGTKENKYPVVLSNDEELGRYLEMLEGKPVFRGVQAEYNDWTTGFSTKGLARLDYVLIDAMTFPGKDGKRVKLWEGGVELRVDMGDKQAFMDRYVDWHLELVERLPADILANVSWLPGPLAGDYDTYWTAARIKKVVDAALRNRVALEIGLTLPKLSFLRIAKEAGVKFSFGTNGRYPNMGKLEPCIKMARELGLKREDMFIPAPDGQKAVQRWKANQDDKAADPSAKKLTLAKKVMSDAKISLADALATAQKKVPDGKPLVARAEVEKNQSRFGFYFLVGAGVKEVEVDVVTGEVVKFEDKKNYEKDTKLANARKAVEGAKVSFPQALEIARGKVKEGKPFEVEMEFDGDRAIVEVEFLEGDMITKVRIDAKDASMVQVVK